MERGVQEVRSRRHGWEPLARWRAVQAAMQAVKLMLVLMLVLLVFPLLLVALQCLRRA